MGVFTAENPPKGCIPSGLFAVRNDVKVIIEKWHT